MEGKVILEGGLATLREARASLANHDIPAELVRPPADAAKGPS